MIGAGPLSARTTPPISIYTSGFRTGEPRGVLSGCRNTAARSRVSYFRSGSGDGEEYPRSDQTKRPACFQSWPRPSSSDVFPMGRGEIFG